MPDEDVEDFLILRELDEPISREDLAATASASEETLESLRNEGTDIRWVSSEVLAEDEGIVGTFCHYRAESEEAVDDGRARLESPTERGGARQRQVRPSRLGAVEGRGRPLPRVEVDGQVTSW